MTPRRRMARADRREQLVHEARLVFLARGYASAAMDEVADRAGVTKPVLYDHFGSKDGLLAAVLQQAGQEMLEATMLAAQGASRPEQALERGLRAYFDLIDVDTDAWTRLLREVSPGTEAAAAVDAIRQAHVDSIAALVQAELRAPDPARAAVYAQIVSGAAERLGAVRLSHPDLTAAQATAQLMDVLWLGLASLHARKG